jgi:glycine/D-amino acid oxidase-like deaminating enzyme
MGTGIAWAPACGKAMAELVVDGESKSIDLRPFDPSRFTPPAQRGGRGRKKQGMNVGEQW